MGRPKKSKEEILARRRLAKRKKYAALKENEDLYAIEKEKERQRYLRRKAENKIVGIKMLTPRGQRERRKKWKINSKKYAERKTEQKRIETVEVCAETSQLDKQSDDIDPLINIASTSANESDCNEDNKGINTDSTEKKLRARIRQLRYERSKEVRRLKCIINDLKKERKKLHRILSKDQINQKNKCKQLNTIKEKPKKKKKGHINKQNKLVLKMIETFFEDDENTRLAPGVKEFITRNKIKKQKRYLNDTLKNLYQKFAKEAGNIRVSYSLFCRNRPFWVFFPKENRNTCMCIYHCNTELLIKALYKAQIVNIKSTHDLLTAICCDRYSEKCLDRKCEICQNKSIEYFEFDNEVDIFYHEWCKCSDAYVKDGKENKKIIWTKKEIYGKPRNVVEKLDNAIEKFLQHCGNILVQSRSLKELKAKLSNNEAVIHLDFSENYCLKHHEEIQSFHFGGSRKQVSIHTVVVYIKCYLTSEVKTHSICTLSDDLRHSALSVWAHIEPVLKYISEISPFIDTLHFYSDSPSSQYRNRHIFYIASQLDQQFLSLRKLTWNYLEVGHGKGAPDGLGAVIKRNADRLVKSGIDIGTFDKFVEVTKANTSSINIQVITSSDIAAKEQNYPKHVPGYRGTMEVHQILWAIENPKQLEMRRRSCFQCLELKCVHYYLGCHKLLNIPAIALSQNEELNIVTSSNVDVLEVRRFSPELIPKRRRIVATPLPVEAVEQMENEVVTPTCSSKVLCPVNRNIETKPDVSKESTRQCSTAISSFSQNQQEVLKSKKRKIQEKISKMTKQEGNISSIMLVKPKDTVTPLSAIQKMGDWQNSTFQNNQSKSYSQEFLNFIEDVDTDENNSQVVSCEANNKSQNKTTNERVRDKGKKKKFTEGTAMEMEEIKQDNQTIIQSGEPAAGSSGKENIKVKNEGKGRKTTVAKVKGKGRGKGRGKRTL